MIFQGISPSFWGGLADSWGRRPIYITTFFIYMCSCIGLACTQNYPMLLMLRMVQAFGSGSAAAISAGSIGKQKKICIMHTLFISIIYILGDITLPSERGGYIGITSMGTTLGPLVGPTLGT